jgi:transcription elongation GreA/GreB family factor
MNLNESTGPHHLSDQARARLEDERQALLEQRRQLSEDLTQRNVTGDRGDEAQALEGADQLAWHDDRIAELERRLTGEQANPEGLPTGTRATLRYPDGTARTVLVVAIPEEAPEYAEDLAVTSDSPLGTALADCSPGETITYSTPEGPVRAEVVDIRPPD